MARRRAKSPVKIFNANYANVKGADAVQRMLAQLPDGITKDIEAAIQTSGQEFVSRAKAVAPVAPAFEGSPGELRDSIHLISDNGREMSVTVMVDAQDAKGRYYPAHVEYGHKVEGGGHAAPAPFFWPVYQTLKKRIKNRVARAMRGAVKSATKA